MPKITRKLRAILHSSFLNRQRKLNLFETLPPELIAIILASLSIVDQICFSLSCKYTFSCFRSYIESHGKTISEILPRRRRPILSADSTRRRRTKLLVRLQTGRWRYCNQCWILHRHSAWIAMRSNWKLYPKPCTSECVGLLRVGIRKCSSPYAGEVQICPCQSITFHQSQHIAEYCRGSRPNLHLDHSSFKVVHVRSGCRGITHRCSVTTNVAKLDIFSLITFCNHCDRLYIRNSFTFEVYDPNLSYSHRAARYRYFPKLCIEKFVHEAGRDFYCGVWGSYTIFDRGHGQGTSNERILFDIDLVRHLGRFKKWPSIHWKLFSKRSDHR